MGQVDVLINAAGFARGVTAAMSLEETERESDSVIDTNLKGSFLTTVAVAPYQVRPGGRIIYTSLIAAFAGGSRAGSIAYAAAKKGVLGLTYGFTRELSFQDFTVNDVAAAVLYLASPETSFVTGEVLNVNGKWLFGH